MEHIQLHYSIMVTLYGNYINTNWGRNLRCHQGSAHTVDTIGLTALLCLITVSQFSQVPLSSTGKFLRSSGSGRQRSMLPPVATEDVTLSYVTAENQQLLPPVSYWDHRSPGQPPRQQSVSVILVDTQAMWIILPAIIYPSQIADVVDS